MDLLFGLGPSSRAYRVFGASVPRWAAAGPPLEVVLLAQLAPDNSGSDLAGLRSRAGFGFGPWRHLQPTRSRGPAQCLQANSDALVNSHIHLSSFPICKAAACKWSRAPAAKVVHLLFYARD